MQTGNRRGGGSSRPAYRDARRRHNSEWRRSSVIARRAFIFGAKSAPGYQKAKQIIRLINGIAEVVNSDAGTTGIQVVFLPNYRVSLAERIFPAAEVSEQISTAGMEASGTGNMKFALNGALTVGTLDGANIDIRERVGADHFFLFGLTADEALAWKRDGYHPQEIYASNAELRQTIDRIAAGAFSDGDPNLFRPIVDNLVYHDEFMLLADYSAYIEVSERAAAAYAGDAEAWTRSSILNTARSGYFSSDRSIRDYCQEIWGVQPVIVE